jgi:hypothetical protein
LRVCEALEAYVAPTYPSTERLRLEGHLTNLGFRT